MYASVFMLREAKQLFAFACVQVILPGCRHSLDCIASLEARVLADLKTHVVGP